MLQKKMFAAVVILLVFGFCGMAVAANNGLAADVTIGNAEIHWQPKFDFEKVILTVSCPDGQVLRKTFTPGAAPYLGLSSENGILHDGSYTYELRILPTVGKRVGAEQEPVSGIEQPRKTFVQSGYFTIRESAFVMPGTPGEEGFDATIQCDYCNPDLHDDVCIGDDCDSTTACEPDLLVLKEGAISILFDDTSTSDPDNDWRIVINDNSAENFTIEDKTGSTKPFIIQAGAIDNSIFVAADDDENYDKVRVGIGTATPAFPVHLKTDDEAALFVAEYTGYAQAKVGAGTVGVQYGSRSNHKVHLVVNNSTKVLTVDTDSEVGIGTETPTHPLEMGSGAYCSSGGAWTDASSIEFKENIANLTNEEAVDTLQGLTPVKYNYKVDKEDKHVGFIAEEVPELVASKDRKGMSPMDVVAVLTKVVQQQQKTISTLNNKIEQLEKRIEEK